MNATDLLGQILQSGMSNSTTSRLQHAMSPEGLGRSGSPLGDLLAQATGQAGTGSGGGMLSGLAEMAQSFLGGGAGKGTSPMAVGGLGALAGALLGGGGGAAKGAIGGGAMALLGGLAVQALKNWGEQGAGPADAEALAREAPLGLREPRDRAEEQELESKAELMLKGMINAAKADGEIDQQELDRIVGKLQDAGADSDAREFVMAELSKPADLDGLVRQARSPEVAVELYAASLLAIEVDTRAEQQYLQDLAQGLGLDAGIVSRIHQALGVSPA